MAERKIILEGDPKIDERVAAGTITPGMLIELTTADKVQAHSTKGGYAAPYFALEDELVGEEITHDWVADDRVRTALCHRGDEVYALLANGENASIGDELDSNGDGYLRVAKAGSAGVIAESIVVRALEAVDLSGSSGADPATYRIKVEVL